MARLLRVNLALGAIIGQQAAQLASLGSGASATSTPAPATPRAALPKPPVTTKPALDMPMVADPKQPAPSRPKQKTMPRPKAPKAGPLFKHMPKSEVKVKAMPKVPKRELTRPSGDESSEDEPKAPATSSKGFALLPKEKWSSMRFSERIEHKKEMRKALPRGSIGDAALKAQGTDCDTCSERRTRGRSAVRRFAEEAVGRAKRRLEERRKEKNEKKEKKDKKAKKGNEEAETRSRAPGGSPGGTPKVTSSKRTLAPRKDLRRPSEPQGPPPKPAAKSTPKAEGPRRSSGFTAGSLAMLKSSLAETLRQNIASEEDPEEQRKMEEQRRALQRDRPRQSIVITRENIDDQSFHDSRYFADRAAGVPHHQAWKNEKGRRRALLNRREGLKERVADRIEKDQEWHRRYDSKGSSHKIDKTDRFEGETVTVDERVRDKDADEPAVEAAPLSKRARANLRQEPDDEEVLLATNPERKAKEPRKRPPGYYQRKNLSRRKRKREMRNKGNPEDDDEEEDENEPPPDRDDGPKGPKWPRGPPDAGAVPVNSFGTLADSAGVVEDVDGWKRIRLNLDTGAAATAIPTELAEVLKGMGYDLGPTSGTTYKTASAEVMQDEGGLCIQGTDSRGNPKGVAGRVTNVHRPLASGSKVAMGHHLALSRRGGCLIPLGSEAAKEYEKFMAGLVRRHGAQLTPVHVENGIYMMDFWVRPRQTNAPELNATGEAEEKEESAPFQGQPRLLRERPAATKPLEMEKQAKKREWRS